MSAKRAETIEAFLCPLPPGLTMERIRAGLIGLAAGAIILGLVGYLTMGKFGAIPGVLVGGGIGFRWGYAKPSERLVLVRVGFDAAANICRSWMLKVSRIGGCSLSRLYKKI